MLTSVVCVCVCVSILTCESVSSFLFLVVGESQVLNVLTYSFYDLAHLAKEELANNISRQQVGRANK